MRVILSLVLSFILSISFIYAQDISESTLLSINGQKTSVSEFTTLYGKNLNLIQDEQQKKLENYLPLFISYKSKLMQAYDLKLDTAQSYISELAGYREELSAPYFKSPNEEEILLKEAFERSKYNLNVSHILINVSMDDSKADTLIAYNKISEIRKDIISGKISFNEAAKKYSQDPSAIKNFGELGWMSVFKMVYPFETAAYNTKENEVSLPVRTRFGYHIVKVNAREKSKGKIQIAHIVLRNIPGSKSDSLNNASHILMDTIYSKLQKGEDFAMLARKYSDDKRSGMNGGVLPVMGYISLMPNMLKYTDLEEGEYSVPFHTNYGWHIQKVVKKYPILSFDDAKEELKKELSKSNRSKHIKESVINHLYDKYKVVVNRGYFNKIESLLDSTFFTSNWNVNYNKEVKVLSIDGVDYSSEDYIDFLKNNPVDARNKYSLVYVLNIKRKSFIDAKLLEYYDGNLENEFPEFKSIMENYRQGILIYNLMNLKIWGKSHTDTVGLAKFYENNKHNYVWPERGNIVIARTFKKENADKVLKYMKRGKSEKYILKKMNKDSQVGVVFQSGIITKTNETLPENIEWKVGVTGVYKKGERDFVIVDILNFVEPQTKTLEESVNKVRSDYQVYLEKSWNKELLDKYKVEIDLNIFNELKKQYKQ